MLDNLPSNQINPDTLLFALGLIFAAVISVAITIAIVVMFDKSKSRSIRSWKRVSVAVLIGALSFPVLMVLMAVYYFDLSIIADYGIDFATSYLSYLLEPICVFFFVPEIIFAAVISLSIVRAFKQSLKRYGSRKKQVMLAALIGVVLFLTVMVLLVMPCSFLWVFLLSIG